MIKVKNILKRENLISAAGLGIGSVAAEVVTNKFAPMVINVHQLLNHLLQKKIKIKKMIKLI